jgi:hypothetical protein
MNACLLRVFIYVSEGAHTFLVLLLLAHCALVCDCCWHNFTCISCQTSANVATNNIFYLYIILDIRLFTPFVQAAQQQKQQQQHHHHQPGQPPPFNQGEFWRAAFRAAPREVQFDLEMSFVERVSNRVELLEFVQIVTRASVPIVLHLIVPLVPSIAHSGLFAQFCVAGMWQLCDRAVTQVALAVSDISTS